MEIVNLANAVLPELPLIPVRGMQGDVEVTQGSDAEAVSRVLSEVSKHSSMGQVAILARTNALLEPYERALSEAGIAFQVKGQGRFFRRPEVMQAMSAIRALGVGELEEPLFAAVSNIVSQLGWSSKPSSDERWLALQWFVDVLDELGEPSLDEYVRELAERERSGHEPQRDAVTLATVHGTKGLEFETVFLVGVNDGSFPSPYAKTEAELAEERRLFFVGVTRAKNRLRIFSSKSKPSPFLSLVGNHS